MFNKFQICLIVFFSIVLLMGCSTPTTPQSSSSGENEKSQETEQKDLSRKDCTIELPVTCNYSTNATLNLPGITLVNCYPNDSYKVEIISNPSNLQLSRNDFSFYEKTIHLFATTPGTIGIRLVNETAKIRSNTCLVTFISNTITDENEDIENDNSTDEQDDQTENPATTNYNILILGTWYCPDAAFSKYLEFYSNGTGKAYASNPSNYSSFNWTISGNTITFTGNVRNVTTFSLTPSHLVFAEYCGHNNLIFSKYKSSNDENNSQPTLPSATTFAGIWRTNYNQGLIDTIIFNSNGTGSYNNSKYPSSGSGTFRWSIANNTTLNIWNSLNQSSTCTYYFTGTTLTLTNFLGLPINTAVTFTKL